jgi:hypothetical protein
MIRLLSSLVLAITRWLFIIVVATALLLVGFIAYKGTQPMGIIDASGMTYWQFIGERIGVIRELPSNCQSLNLVTYLTIPPYSLMYTYVGVYPDSLLAKLTSPNDPWLIKENLQLQDAPEAWWSQIEHMSWHALTTDRIPLPECNIGPPNLNRMSK